MPKELSKPIDELVLENQPLGFLEQLGKSLGKIVGLGEHQVKQGHKRIWITIPVRSADDVLGNYTIKVSENELLVVYNGYHPLANGYLELFANKISKDNLIRQDNLTELPFP